MLDWLYQWMKNIAYYMLLISAVLTVLTGKEYQKYIQFFSGLVLIILLVTPFFRVAGMEVSLEEIYQNKAYEQEMKEIEMMGKYFENVDILDFVPDEYIQEEKSTGKNTIVVEPIEIN
ncbi:MAG: stage III sporulation protein AF [Ruminococcus sp.]|nr:stage III sporulation protein AF [Ruminococcus sp.]